MRMQIKRLEEPSMQCVQMIYDELLRILQQLEQRKVAALCAYLPRRTYLADAPVSV